MRGWSYVIRRDRTSYRHHRDLQDCQGQQLQAVEPDQGVLQVKTQRTASCSRVHTLAAEFLVYSMHVCMGKAADDLHRRRRDPHLEDASFQRTDIASVTEPKDVTEYMVRVSCDRLDVWRFGVQSQGSK